ncbi:uncharacterized protein LOC129589422 [Paramacrobiotus metropolitanus]|uniref:uncharacterized protein LOC129589422 n=1 Tax=Paramacrobiotus metropolitanus TaxID=2943436 RepID=UPI0024464900|nr:uncharacterized protein LOC129589422 [Paramacrobiotus metropolitanus]
MGAHRNVNKRKKDTSKIRRERKEIKRTKAATSILRREGRPVTETTVKNTVKDLQGKQKTLQHRLSKKKQRKIVKQLMHEKKLQNQMEVETGTLTVSKPVNDVEMR